jgi:hypothetical protein
MKTMTILRTLVGSAAILCATMAVGVTAEARSVLAMSGTAETPSQATCFGNSLGTIINNCSSTVDYCVMLPVDSSSHTITASVLAPDINHEISCYAMSVNSDGSYYSSTPGGAVQPSGTGSHRQINLGNLYVPGGGGLFSCCTMAPTSRFDTVNW